MTYKVLEQGVTVLQEWQPLSVFLLCFRSNYHPQKSLRKLAELAEQPPLESAIIKMSLFTEILYKFQISFLLFSKKINIFFFNEDLGQDK